MNYEGVMCKNRLNVSQTKPHLRVDSAGICLGHSPLIVIQNYNM